jgi:quinolinate synthase
MVFHVNAMHAVALPPGKHRITVEPELADRARLAIERMVSIT